MNTNTETAAIKLPPKLLPVFSGEARYRGAFGGRGSGKTRSFALMAALRGWEWSRAGKEGQILCCRNYMNSLEESSLEEIKAAIRSYPWLLDWYDVGEKYIRTKDGRVRFTFAGLARNIDSIKSRARVLLCWVDEAEAVTEDAWVKLIPTVREDASEIWVTWNPERKGSATDRRFRRNSHEKVVRLNYSDNPFFPKVLEDERKRDQADRPDEYAHIWEGEYRRTFRGAYYADLLLEAEKDGRISHVAQEKTILPRSYWDIGGTGRFSDATAIWVAQHVGKELRVLDYYEAVGQPLDAHTTWLRDNGYDKITCVLPHDGINAEKVYATTYASALNRAGFSTVVVPNQGPGAAMGRIRAGRQALPSMWFDHKTEAGRDALALYHERRDEERNIGLGPRHDETSHAADAFGLMALAFLHHDSRTSWSKPLKVGIKGVA